MSSLFAIATLCEILGVPAAPTFEHHSIQGITTDTRTLSPGDLFVALRGETFDGHTFLPLAIEKGAVAAIVDYEVEINNPGFPLIVVPDTLVAYQQVAHWWRKRFHHPVIAITGSVGKTTTKELIAGVLSHFGRVHKSQANFNNEIGVPKTLLQLDPAQHDFAIVEMGMRGRGEIALLSKITQPEIAVITNVGTAHIGRLGSEQAIAEAKCELLAEMASSGVVILNHDNQRLMDTAATVWSGKTITFGLTGGDVHGTLLNSNTLQVNDITLPLPLPGAHNAINYLAALAVAQVLGLSWEPLKQGIHVDLPGGRARQYQVAEDILFLDETYNAGLESMLASLRLLASLPGQRRIAVLGTMKELGDRAQEFHAQVGTCIRELGLDAVFVLADEPIALAIADAATPVPSASFSSHEDLIQQVQSDLHPGDRYLFKASRSVGLDRVVDTLRTSLTES